MWTRAQVAAYARALAAARKHDPMVARLERMAQYAPAFQARMSEIRILCDSVRMLAETALAIDPTGSDGNQPEG